MTNITKQNEDKFSKIVFSNPHNMSTFKSRTNTRHSIITDLQKIGTEVNRSPVNDEKLID